MSTTIEERNGAWRMRGRRIAATWRDPRKWTGGWTDSDGMRGIQAQESGRGGRSTRMDRNRSCLPDSTSIRGGVSEKVEEGESVCEGPRE